jgi:hypothetical protein
MDESLQKSANPPPKISRLNRRRGHFFHRLLVAA